MIYIAPKSRNKLGRITTPEHIEALIAGLAIHQIKSTLIIN